MTHETGRRDSLPIDQWSNLSEDAPMRVSSMQRTRRECDGCGVPAPRPDPVGWFDRELDPPYYTGPWRLLFCPHCFATLAADQRPRWRRLGEARLQLRTERQHIARERPEEAGQLLADT